MSIAFAAMALFVAAGWLTASGRIGVDAYLRLVSAAVLSYVAALAIGGEGDRLRR